MNNGGSGFKVNVVNFGVGGFNVDTVGNVTAVTYSATQNCPFNLTNQVSGAGSATGTLTNAPSAGNPNFWLPVKINGTTRYIPAW